VPCVPTGKKAGVSIVPWGVIKVPTRAFDFLLLLLISKEIDIGKGIVTSSPKRKHQKPEKCQNFQKILKIHASCRPPPPIIGVKPSARANLTVQPKRQQMSCLFKFIEKIKQGDAQSKMHSLKKILTLSCTAIFISTLFTAAAFADFDWDTTATELFTSGGSTRLLNGTNPKISAGPDGYANVVECEQEGGTTYSLVLRRYNPQTASAESYTVTTFSALYTDDYDIAIDTYNNIYIIWEDRTTNTLKYKVCRNSGSSYATTNWDAEKTLVSASMESEPALATSGTLVYAAICDSTGFNIKVYDVNLGTLKATISTSTVSPSFPVDELSFAMDSDGEYALAWTNLGGSNIYFRSSITGVITNICRWVDNYHPRVAYGGDYWHIVWCNDNVTPNYILYERRNLAGTTPSTGFSNLPINGSCAINGEPVIAANDRHLYVLFTSRSSATSDYYIYVTHIDLSGSSFDTPKITARTDATSSYYSNQHATIAFDSKNCLHAVYNDTDNFVPVYNALDFASPESFSTVSPESNAQFNTRRVVLNWNKTTDYFTGVDHYTTFISNDGVSFTANSTVSAVASRDAFIGSEGNYNWYVKAYDEVGHVRASNSSSPHYFVIDLTPHYTPVLAHPSV
jgi:hypothetical protein